MKVRELMEALKDLDPNAEVILQKDSEGNGYSPCVGADGDCIYVPENTWSGDVYPTNQSADENCLEEDEWNEMLKGPRCVVLWPIN